MWQESRSQLLQMVKKRDEEVQQQATTWRGERETLVRRVQEMHRQILWLAQTITQKPLTQDELANVNLVVNDAEAFVAKFGTEFATQPAVQTLASTQRAYVEGRVASPSIPLLHAPPAPDVPALSPAAFGVFSPSPDISAAAAQAVGTTSATSFLRSISSVPIPPLDADTRARLEQMAMSDVQTSPRSSSTSAVASPAVTVTNPLRLSAKLSALNPALAVPSNVQPKIPAAGGGDSTPPFAVVQLPSEDNKASSPATTTARPSPRAVVSAPETQPSPAIAGTRHENTDRALVLKTSPSLTRADSLSRVASATGLHSPASTRTLTRQSSVVGHEGDMSPVSRSVPQSPLSTKSSSRDVLALANKQLAAQTQQRHEMQQQFSQRVDVRVHEILVQQHMQALTEGTYFIRFSEKQYVLMRNSC
eukprot:TRINITY_DN5903_c0_g2_i1.p1 TRINITY_DN5903_c0_g2~~TRINITY_DN5903_c0_g2_i1.p1  ORF type:complete len:420 (-),score=114.56 TRINITY_DN5903_c0_g2_i1:1373-2632(-)